MTQVSEQLNVYSDSIESIRTAEKATEDARTVFVCASGEQRKIADAALGTLQIAERSERDRLVESMANDEDNGITPIVRAVAGAALKNRRNIYIDQAITFAEDKVSAIERISEHFTGSNSVVARLWKTASSGNADSEFLGLYTLADPQGSAPVQVRKAIFQPIEEVALYLPGGQVEVCASDTREFPKLSYQGSAFVRTLVTPDTFSIYQPGSNIVKLDPESGAYEPEVLFLGSKDMPNEDINNVIGTSDEHRYAARFLSNRIDQAWLDIPKPSEEFKNRVVTAFSRIFADLLLDQTPWDIDQHKGQPGFKADNR